VAQIYANAAAGTITDNPLGTTATTINSANFANLPTVAAPDFMYLTLDPTGVGGLPEIVKITAHTASATSITVVRYAQVQAGLTAASGRTHVLNTIWRHIATKASFDDLQANTPAGTVRQTVNTAADPGWLLFNQTVVGAQTLYPALWAVAPAAWKSGADLVLPAVADKVIAAAGATANGDSGGANTKVIASGNLPLHTHTGGAHVHSVDPPDTAVAITDPGHVHQQQYGAGGAGGLAAASNGLQGAPSGVNTVSATTGITASVNIPAFDSVTGGAVATSDGGFANTALDVRNSHLALTYQIKAH
jgi:hypothetical protein